MKMLAWRDYDATSSIISGQAFCGGGALPCSSREF